VNEPKRTEWEAFRNQCFIRCSLEPIWVWSAAHDFEACHVGLFLSDVPGYKIDLGTHAMSIFAFDHWHVIPLARMTVKSLEHLEGVATFSPVERRAELLDAQVAAEGVLRGLVDRQFLFKAAPGSAYGSLQ
jgi:hypothetical protein